MSTQNPARLMGLEGTIGCLSEGANADIAIFDWVDLHQTYLDWKGEKFVGTKQLYPDMTIKNGQILYCAPDFIYEEDKK